MTAFRVDVSARVDDKIARKFGADRTTTGGPSFYDFETGPLAAARLAFSRFDGQREAAGPSIRTVTIVDPFFGAVVFTDVLVGEYAVEVADASIDTTYWDHVDQDPADYSVSTLPMSVPTCSRSRSTRAAAGSQRPPGTGTMRSASTSSAGNTSR